MRAVIIAGGQIKDYTFIKSQLQPNDTIICADSGYIHAKEMGLSISVAVGDFDSLGFIPKDTPVVAHPSDKNLTDTEIAIDYAREKGFTDFLLLAATGTRYDHSLTNILLLKSFLSRGETAVIVDEHNKIMMTNYRLQIKEAPGSIISLVPLEDCYGVCTKNLLYPLNGDTLYVGKGLSVSNVMMGYNAEVSVKEGLLLIIVARD